jgi:hypothetical protein
MSCRVEAVGAPAGAVEATAVSRRVDEDLATRGGVAGPDPLGPDRRDEIDQLAYRDRREAFVQPESWPGRERKRPAAVGARHDLCACDGLRDDCVEAGDEVGGARGGQDVEQPAAEGLAALEVMPMDGRVDAVLVEKAEECFGVSETLRLGQVRIQGVGKVDRQDLGVAEPPHGRHAKRLPCLTAYPPLR